MAQYAHKGEILPLANQMIPIDKETTLHASYDYHLNGMNRGQAIFPMGPERCLDFNGTNSLVSPGKIFESTPSAVTVEVWFNARAISGYPTIIDFGVPGNAFYMEQYTATQLMIGGYVGTGGANFSGLTNEVRVSYALNTWTHVAYTATPTDLRVYVNGVIAGNFPASYNLSMFTNPATIGGGRNLFNGTIADVRVWNFAKSEGQIKEDMYKTFSGGESGLVAYWKLSETEGSIAYDASGNGRDGVISGTIGRTITGMTVATLQKDGGKFGGAALIEPDTINLMAGRNMSVDTSVGVVGGTDGIGNYFIPQNRTQGWAGIRIPGTSVAAGQKYTVSFEILCDKSFNLAWDPNITGTGYTGNDAGRNSSIPSTTVYDTPGQWKRIWLVNDIKADLWTTTPQASDSFCPGDSRIMDGTKIYYRNPQIEQRDYPTSHIASARPLGKLWYPKELINLSSFTVSCWFKIPYLTRVSSMGGGIKGWWYNPIIELAPQVSTSNPAFSVVANPQPTGYDRLINLRIASNVDGEHRGVTSIQDDTWYHMVLTYDKTNYKLYINGNLEVTYANATPATTTNDTVLMVGGGWAGKAFTYIDELRIESRAISADEVSAWAASGLHYNYLDYSTYVD